MSGFPALGQQHQPPQRGGMPVMMMSPNSSGGAPYSGLGGKVKSPRQEFNMQKEEFPALPGMKTSKSPDMPGSPRSGGNPPGLGGPMLQGDGGVRASKREGLFVVSSLYTGSAHPHEPRAEQDPADKYGVLGLLDVIWCVHPVVVQALTIMTA